MIYFVGYSKSIDAYCRYLKIDRSEIKKINQEHQSRGLKDIEVIYLFDSHRLPDFARIRLNLYHNNCKLIFKDW